MSFLKLLCCLFTLVFCLTSFAQNADDVVAVVGSKTLTKKEFDQKYKNVVSKSFSPPSKDLFLEDLVRYEVGVLEAQKRNLENDPIVQERIRQVMYVDLVEKELGKKADQLTATEKEMESFYAKNPELRTSHILIEIKDKATAQEREIAKKRAGEIYAEIKSSKKPFEQLVKLYSDDVVSKKNGGDIGWHTSISLVPEYYNTAAKLSLNQVSPIIETRFGFHIIKLTGKKTFKEADRAALSAAIKEQKKKVLFDDFFTKLKSKYSVKTFSQKL